MKVSSMSGNHLETGFVTHHQGKPLIDTIMQGVAPLQNLIHRIGASIELGEKGDLDAAHEFRMQALHNKNK